MFEILRTSQFKRDAKKAKKRGKNTDRLKTVIVLLAQGRTLPRVSCRTRLASHLPNRSQRPSTCQNRFTRRPVHIEHQVLNSPLIRFAIGEPLTLHQPSNGPRRRSIVASRLLALQHKPR